MPIVQIDFLEGRTIDQKRALAKKITEAFTETLQCKPEAVTIIIREMSKENLATAGKLRSDM